MAKLFECGRDGVLMSGEDDDELVANVERHVADAHPDSVGKRPRDDILAMAKNALTTREKGGSR